MMHCESDRSASAWLAVAWLLAAAAPLTAEDRQPAPNFVFIFCDNLGYGDTEPFGSRLNQTPNLNRMVREGRKFTDFYAAAGVCTPSRASFLTGCYPRRVNMHESDPMSPSRWPLVTRELPATKVSVLWPASPKGLHPDEVTIAEVLRPRGYASICIGKWHLGDQTPLLPTRQGFDEFFGIPYSEGMMAHWDQVCPPLPLMENERVIEAPVDCNLLTQRYTHRAIQFIHDHKDRPFFLYLAHAMPGSIPDAFASQSFKGKSKGGPWGDKVEEIDWSTGVILDTLQELGIAQKTFVVWTSDNGAGRLPEGARGSNLPLKGWGYSTSEAGMRVPCIMWWPGKIPASTTCRELATTMDMWPTYERLSRDAAPGLPAAVTDRVIDGKDIWPLVSNQPSAKSPHQAFFFYYMDQLQAVRSGKWKLYLPLEAKRRSPFTTVPQVPAELYDLEADISETNNLAEHHSQIVERLMTYAEEARRDLGDFGTAGTGQRPAGWVPDPKPQLLSDR